MSRWMQPFAAKGGDLVTHLRISLRHQAPDSFRQRVYNMGLQLPRRNRLTALQNKGQSRSRFVTNPGSPPRT